MRRTRAGRLLALFVVLAASAVLAQGYLAASTDAGVHRVGQSVAPPRAGTTVVATDSNAWLGRGSEGPRARAELFAVGPSGRVVYYDDSHTRYWDVDPVPGTAATVEYVYADHLTPEQCGGESVCTRNGIERVNLTTGRVRPVFSRVTAGKHSTRWHDADRLDADHLAVADIAADRVFVVNTTSGIVTWAWSAQAAFAVNGSGGPYPGDWTHLNDVEPLDDGRIQVSLRNHDQVVYLDRDTGLVENWTLGADGDHRTLYEQHNPDFIPRKQGGPAVVVADSENNRVVEYQRVADSWERSWAWRDARLRWPRDADRLPDGHTLVTDSNGDRVVEVNERGEVVWTLPVAFPYEAERLGTGDESTGGPSARAANLTGGLASDGGSAAESPDGPLDRLAGLTRGPTVNAVLYVLPAWMDRLHLAALLVLAATLVVWAGAEAYRSPWTATVRWPVEFRRR
ncbi:aryl-sulfate sulfotransferase [Halorarius halobius]|uniref:aryl-sulfate sulfotransferase n=1 Tax=Halorarius halobius TaxID=2962671 RepID=UPI0020CFA775|nr:aryl-sulfate sulfotransferase [Halorarius halobius]